MLKTLSALANLTIICGLTGMAVAQCPPVTIGVYFDSDGSMQSVQPVQHQ